MIHNTWSQEQQGSAFRDMQNGEEIGVPDAVDRNVINKFRFRPFTGDLGGVYEVAVR